MKTENEIIDILYKQYQSQGYITEQAIFDLCDDNSLSFLATDRVCNRLIDLGVLINEGVKYDLKPIDESTENIIKDYSQIDYNVVFDFYIQNYPQMHPIISYIKALPPPQKGENNNLVIQMRSGNKYARTQAIEMNLRTALRIAMNYNDKTSIPVDELFSVACEGLIAAVDSFDPYSNSYFTSYSSFWIMQKIDRYIMDNQYLIRIPVHTYETLNKVITIVEQNDYNYDNSVLTEIKDSFSLTENEALEWLRIVTSLNIVDIDELTDDEKLAFLSDNSTIETLTIKALSYEVELLLDKLTKRERLVLTLRYGFYNNKCLTLGEIASICSVTRERIRQIEATAIRKITNYIRLSPLYQEYTDKLLKKKHKRSKG